jgi:putative acetyltransferase
MRPVLAIEPFLPADHGEALALWRASEGIGLSAADSLAGVEAFLEHNDGLSFVARRDGQLVGAVLCGTDGRRGYLHHLAVAPSERRRGTGRALAERCIQELRRRGIAKCHLFVLSGNAAALEFWAAAGWVRREDIVVMSRAIPP